MNDNVIDIQPLLIERALKSGEAFLCCPKCFASDCWAVASNEVLDITKLVCVSDLCDGQTRITVNAGMIE